MTTDLQEAAHEIFKASGEDVGPLALKIIRKGKGGLGMVSVEVLGAAPHSKPPAGLFFSLVNRLDVFDDDVFVDFSDVEELIAYPWRLAKEGLARCKGLRLGALEPVGDDLLEQLVDVFVWQQVLREMRVPSPVEALARASTVAPSAGLDLPAILQAHAFQRLSRVPSEARQLGAVTTFFGQAVTALAEKDRRWREGFMEEHRKAGAAMQEVQSKINTLRQTIATLEGGSYHPDYPYHSWRMGDLSADLKKLQEEESSAQRAGWIAQQRARGEARRRLYGTPSPAPSPEVNEAPPAA